MSTMHHAMRLKAAATYDAAADHCDDPQLAFWDRHGRRTIAKLRLRPGSRVLDVGCGAGTSAIPAAMAVRPEGYVTGIDVAESMLARARAKAAAKRLDNVTFAMADMAASGLPEASYDAVVSVFSVFFVADMERQVAEFLRLLRPGGQLAVTVWGPRAFEPAGPMFQDEMRRVRRDIAEPSRPWQRLTDPAGLERLLLDGGAVDPIVDTVSDAQPLETPADWWTIALGSGFRWQIDHLTAQERQVVQERITQRLSFMGVTSVDTSANFAIAWKAA